MQTRNSSISARRESVDVTAGDVRLEGILGIPRHARGIVLFAHGSGSSRSSPRNQRVAEGLHDVNLATLLFDLLTESEDADYDNRFDIALLAERMVGATEWVRAHPDTQSLPLGFFGASTGAAAALRAAARLGAAVAAVVSRGGRPDLTGAELRKVRSPTLLIVGELDSQVLELNQRAYDELKAEKKLEIVSKATHLFEEPGALDEVTRLASRWFVTHLPEPRGESEAPSA